MCSSLVTKYHSDTVRVILTPEHAKNYNNITIIIYNMQELLYLIWNGCSLDNLPLQHLNECVTWGSSNPKHIQRSQAEIKSLPSSCIGVNWNIQCLIKIHRMHPSILGSPIVRVLICVKLNHCHAYFRCRIFYICACVTCMLVRKLCHSGGVGWNQYLYCTCIYIYYVNNSTGNSPSSVKYCNNENVYIHLHSYTE